MGIVTSKRTDGHLRLGDLLKLHHACSLGTRAVKQDLFQFDLASRLKQLDGSSFAVDYGGYQSRAGQPLIGGGTGQLTLRTMIYDSSRASDRSRNGSGMTLTRALYAEGRRRGPHLCQRCRQGRERARQGLVGANPDVL